MKHDFVRVAAEKTAGLTEHENYHLFVNLPMRVGEDSVSMEVFLADVWSGGNVTPADFDAIEQAFGAWVRRGLK